MLEKQLQPLQLSAARTIPDVMCESGDLRFSSLCCCLVLIFSAVAALCVCLQRNQGCGLSKKEYPAMNQFISWLKRWWFCVQTLNAGTITSEWLSLCHICCYRERPFYYGEEQSGNRSWQSFQTEHWPESAAVFRLLLQRRQRCVQGKK